MNLRVPEWIWKGAWSDIKHPFEAFFIAPLFSLLPIALFLVAQGKITNVEYLTVFFGFTLLVSYGITLILGIPWFLFLSRRGYAGLLPVMAASVVPSIVLYLRTGGRHYSDTGFYYFFFPICGLLVSTAFWKIARRTGASR